MSLTCKVRAPEQVGRRCDPPNDTFTSVRELTNHLYSKHHVPGAVATIEARQIAANAFPGRDLKPNELVGTTKPVSMPTEPTPTFASSSPSGGKGTRHCSVCGRPGTRADYCPDKATHGAATKPATVSAPPPARADVAVPAVTSVPPPPVRALSVTMLRKRLDEIEHMLKQAHGCLDAVRGMINTLKQELS